MVAKAQITITRLDDGYTINTTPSSIVIPSNSDGSSPILTGAKTRVLLSKAGVNISITIASVVGTGCTASFTGNEVIIISVSADTGNLQINFSSTDGSYTSSVNVPFSKSKNGADGLSIVLSNEVHALPANHDGSVTQASIDLAVCAIAVRRGSIPLTPVAANATPGIGQFRYNVPSVTAGTAVRVNNNTFKLSTITASTCVIKVLIYAESLSNPIEKEMVITKVIGSDPTEFNQVKSIFDNWKFADSTEIDGNKIRSGTVTADKINTLNLLARHISTSDTLEKLTINANNDNSIKIRHTNGQVGIQMGLIGGVPKLVFYNEYGNKVWEGGMSGIVYVDNVPESWSPVNFKLLPGNHSNVIPDVNGNITSSEKAQLKSWVNTGSGFLTTDFGGQPIISTGATFYSYSAGINAQAENNRVYEGLHTSQLKSTGNWMPNGWYGQSGTALYQVSEYPVKVYATTLEYYANGRMIASILIDDITML